MLTYRDCLTGTDAQGRSPCFGLGPRARCTEIYTGTFDGILYIIKANAYPCCTNRTYSNLLFSRHQPTLTISAPATTQPTRRHFHVFVRSLSTSCLANFQVASTKIAFALIRPSVLITGPRSLGIRVGPWYIFRCRPQVRAAAASMHQ